MSITAGYAPMVRRRSAPVGDKVSTPEPKAYKVELWVSDGAGCALAGPVPGTLRTTDMTSFSIFPDETQTLALPRDYEVPIRLEVYQPGTSKMLAQQVLAESLGAASLVLREAEAA